jgi:hypothetical protein
MIDDKASGLITSAMDPCRFPPVGDAQESITTEQHSGFSPCIFNPRIASINPQADVHLPVSHVQAGRHCGYIAPLIM